MKRREFIKKSLLTLLGFKLTLVPKRAFAQNNSLLILSGIQKLLPEVSQEYSELLDICSTKDIPTIILNYEHKNNFPNNTFKQLLEIPRLQFLPHQPKFYNTIPKTPLSPQEIANTTLDSIFQYHPQMLEERLYFNNLIILGHHLSTFTSNQKFPIDTITSPQLNTKTPLSFTKYSFNQIKTLLKEHHSPYFSNITSRDKLSQGWAVAIIDMQKEFLKNVISINQQEILISNMIQVLEHARHNEIPILTFENQEYSPTISPLQHYSSPKNTYRRLDKNALIRLKKTDLPNIEKLFIMGIYSHDCITATIKGAHKLGLTPATSRKVIKDKYSNTLTTLQHIPNYTLYSSNLEDFLL